MAKKSLDHFLKAHQPKAPEAPKHLEQDIYSKLEKIKSRNNFWTSSLALVAASLIVVSLWNPFYDFYNGLYQNEMSNEVTDEILEEYLADSIAVVSELHIED